MKTRFLVAASFQPDPTGKEWHICLVKEGPSVDGRFCVTREAILDAFERGLFEDVYIQEFVFKPEENYTDHLHEAGEADAPSGVFGNSVGWTKKPYLKVLQEAGYSQGRLAVMAIFQHDGVSETFRQKLLSALKLGKQRLPGLSFNAEVAAWKDQVAQVGRRSFDILKFHIINTFDTVTHPAAGGGFLGIKASTFAAKEGFLMNLFEQLTKVLDTKGIPYAGADVLSVLQSIGIGVPVGVEVQAPGMSDGDTAFFSGILDAVMQGDSVGALAQLGAPIDAVVESAEPSPVEEVLPVELDIEGAKTELPIVDPKIEEMEEESITQKPPVEAATETEKSEPSEEEELDPPEVIAGGGQFGAIAETVTTLASAQKDIAGMVQTLGKQQAQMTKAFTSYKEGEHFKSVRASNLKKVRRVLASSGLHEAYQDMVFADLETAPVLTMDLVKGKIKKVKAAAQKATPKGHVEVAGNGNSMISMGPGIDEKLYIAGCKGLGVKASAKEQSTWDGVPAEFSLRSLYTMFTGDAEVSGRINRKVMASSYLTTTFSDALGNMMNRRLMELYRQKEQPWRQCVSVRKGKVTDFRPQYVVQIGGLADLSLRGEDGEYQELTLTTDDSASYVVQGRGNIIKVTREIIKNDDIGAIDRIQKMANRAAHRTIAKLVFGCLIGSNINTGAAFNDTNIYDGNKLYDAANHLNYQTLAFSHANFVSLVELLGNQTEMTSNEPLDLDEANLMMVLSKELKHKAKIYTRSELVPGTADNDANVIDFPEENILAVNKKYLMNDTTGYYVFPDPKEYEGIELAFMDGREEPEWFVQDNPTVGTPFTNDQIRYKIRHEYACAVINYRAFACGRPA